MYNRDWQTRRLIGRRTRVAPRISDDPSMDRTLVGRTDGQLPIANVAIPARSTRRHRHGHAVIEFHSRNHVRILSRGNSRALFFPPFPLRGSSTLNFYRAFPPASPAREDRWRDLGLLCSRNRLSALENSTRPLFFSPRSVLLQIPGSKPHSPWIIGRGEHFNTLT